jgi:hypothetical protein
MVNQVDTLFRTKFMDEFKYDFEREQALMKMTVRSDGVVMADTVKFDIVDPSDGAVEKGRDGKVPKSDLGLSQATATLRKIHKKYQIDNFDIFRGNPTIRAAMNRRGISSINTGIDKLVIDTLDTTSVEVAGGATTLSTLATVLTWTTTLWNKDIPNDGNVYAVITPNAEAQLMRVSEFKNADFIEEKAMVDGAKPQKLRYWMGCKWLVHTGLSGSGTSSAKMYLYHQSAIGHMVSGEPAPNLFESQEDDYVGVRYDAIHAAAICLPRGIVRLLHNDTAAFS